MKLLICAVVLLACVAQTSAIFDLIAKIFEAVKMPGKEVKLLGCYTDGPGGCLVPNIFGGCLLWNQAPVFAGARKEYHPDEVVKRCLEDAVKNGADTFAIQDQKFCFAEDKEARHHYGKYGARFIAPFCLFGKGGWLSNDVYQITKAEPVRTDIVTAPPPAPLPKCTFASGDGSGGSEVKVGDQVGDECIRACVEEKKSDKNINGVTVMADGKPGCWCEQAMKQRKPSNKYKSCFLDDKKPAPVDPKPPSAYHYADWKNKDCGNRYEAAGCHGENASFDRKDAELLVYWRHDIEWGRDRLGAFGKSLVCACQDAAQKAGLPFFAIHYWGECWGVNMNDMTKLDGGDCVRANFSKRKCRSHGQNICLADKHFMIYSTMLLPVE